MDVVIVTTFVVLASFLFGYYAGKEEAKKSAGKTIKLCSDEAQTK